MNPGPSPRRVAGPPVTRRAEPRPRTRVGVVTPGRYHAASPSRTRTSRGTFGPARLALASGRGHDPQGDRGTIVSASPSGSAAAPGVPPCPACEGRDFRKSFTKKGHDFWKCASCGLERQQPLPTLAELKAYYDGSYTEGMYKEFTSATEMKRMTAAQRYKEVRPYVPPGRWLDVGCANGVFIDHVRGQGIDAHGIELSDVAVAQAKERGLPVVQSTVEDYRPDAPFDAVTCFDLVEHVIDPVQCLTSIRGLLRDGGKVAITVPNQGSVIRKLMGPRWYFYIPEEHLHYFNPSTIRRFLSRTGFDTERCGQTWKPLTYRYSLTQFVEYNPSIYKVMNAASKLMPASLLDWTLPLYIGEMMVIARKR